MYLSDFLRIKHLYANDIETMHAFAYETRNSFELQTIVCILKMLIYMIDAHKPAETKLQPCRNKEANCGFPKQVSGGIAFR